jgi:hypothetical protein
MLHPGELVICGPGGERLVRIQPDGSIIYGEHYTPDEAAVSLWTAIGQRRLDFEGRMQYLNLLELHIALLAVSDAAYEVAQRAAREEGATETERFREEMSRRSLETRVHGIIEFAREFAMMRPDLVAQARRVVPGACETPATTGPEPPGPPAETLLRGEGPEVEAEESPPQTTPPV